MKRALSLAALTLLAVSFIAWTSRSNAQAVYGSILGTVTDPHGAAVVGGNVTVTDQNKGTTETTTTNDSGNYSVTHLIPDPYSVKIEAQGFKAAEQKGIIVAADNGSRVDVQLQLGSTAEAVEVTARNGKFAQRWGENLDSHSAIDLNWQAVYRYERPVFLPKGTTISMHYVYDNSQENALNPNHTPERVRGGNRARDEMAHLWLQVLPRNFDSKDGDPRMLLQEALARHDIERSWGLRGTLQSSGCTGVTRQAGRSDWPLQSGIEVASRRMRP
jgi:Carboxypeptidase regulatory-like domain